MRPTFTPFLRGSLLIKRIVTIRRGLVPIPVVRSSPRTFTFRSESDVGPETVDVISHHVHPVEDATWTAPHAYAEHFVTCAASGLAAERTPINSLLVGTLAYTFEFSWKPFGGQAGAGEGDIAITVLEWTVLFFITRFFVTVFLGIALGLVFTSGFGVGFVVAAIESGVDVRSAPAIRIDSAPLAILDSI